MAERRFCECSCGLEITEYDAGQMAALFRSPGGLQLRVEVLPNETGRQPMIRVACLQRLIHQAELVFPKLPIVDDESEDRVVKLPERAAKGLKG